MEIQEKGMSNTIVKVDEVQNDVMLTQINRDGNFKGAALQDYTQSMRCEYMSWWDIVVMNDDI